MKKYWFKLPTHTCLMYMKSKNFIYLTILHFVLKSTTQALAVIDRVWIIIMSLEIMIVMSAIKSTYEHEPNNFIMQITLERSSSYGDIMLQCKQFETKKKQRIPWWLSKTVPLPSIYTCVQCVYLQMHTTTYSFNGIATLKTLCMSSFGLLWL